MDENKYTTHLNRKKIDRSKGSLFNSWRSKVYTRKGKKIGFPDKWKTFEGFKEDVEEGWIRGLLLIRKDITKGYSKENCTWSTKDCQGQYRCIKFEYNGIEKFLYEWCLEFKLNYNGVKKRYYQGKNYTKKQILFGKYKGKKREILDPKNLTKQQKRDKASKMLAQYRLSDRKKGLNDYDLSIEYMVDIFNKPCFYCGVNDKIGLDRKNNGIGHTKKNCVPCCYRCNVVRGYSFTHEEMIFLSNTIKKIDLNRVKSQ